MMRERLLFPVERIVPADRRPTTNHRCFASESNATTILFI